MKTYPSASHEVRWHLFAPDPQGLVSNQSGDPGATIDLATSKAGDSGVTLKHSMRHATQSRLSHTVSQSKS